MVGEPDATMQPAPQDNQLMSKHRVLSFKPYLRLERRGQDGQNETEQPDHFASLGNSVTSSTRIGFLGFLVHTGPGLSCWLVGAKFGQKPGGFHQIPGVMAFCKPVVDRRQRGERLSL